MPSLFWYNWRNNYSPRSWDPCLDSCSRIGEIIIAFAREKSYMSLAVCCSIPEKINSFKSDRFLDPRNLLLSIFHWGSVFSAGHICNQMHTRITNNHTCTCTPCTHAWSHMCIHAHIYHSPYSQHMGTIFFCPKLNLNIQSASWIMRVLQGLEMIYQLNFKDLLAFLHWSLLSRKICNHLRRKILDLS